VQHFRRLPATAGQEQAEMLLTYKVHGIPFSALYRLVRLAHQARLFIIASEAPRSRHASVETDIRRCQDSFRLLDEKPSRRN
jgi:hypothetical protein